MMYKRINGLQHIGVAVQNMDVSLVFYRKFFGLNIPFFDSVQPAPLMNYYTRGETITKRASMVMNLQGGCAIEVIQPTSFVPKKAAFDIRLGDRGILITQVKSRDIEASYRFCKQHGAPGLSAIAQDPLGRSSFFITDPDGHWWQFVHDDQQYSKGQHHSGGVLGCTVGVSDIDESLKLYASILGFDKIESDLTGSFPDWRLLPGGQGHFRRVVLSQSNQPGGGFAKVTGKTYIELVQDLDHEGRGIYDDRIWGDTGFVHIGLDVKGMKPLGMDLEAGGFGFTCDSLAALSMGNTKVHCTYIHDRDRTLIELIEVYKVPILEKYGIYLNVEKRDPLKPLPDVLLKALRFSRIIDK
jgi:catechol 2,3-dioxygenase-like lactoylglutathione lyase family enzyme